MLSTKICKGCSSYRINENIRSRHGYNEFCMKKGYYDILWIASKDFEIPKDCPFVLEHLMEKSK